MTPRPPATAAPSRASSAFAAVLALTLAAAAAADYKESYRRGLDAIERQQWREAVQHLRLAIAERPEASGLLSGPLFRRYTPHYHLGVALAESGDCRGAIEAFDASQQQGKLGRDEVADLEQRRAACQRLVQGVDAAVTAAQEAVDAAAAEAFAVAGIERSPVMGNVWGEGAPSFADRQEPATARLAEARSALRSGQERLSLADVERAAALAAEARSELVRLRRDAEARQAALEERASRELAEMGRVVDSAERDLRYVRGQLAPLAPRAAAAADALAAAIQEAGQVGMATPISALEALHDRLRRDLRELRAAVKAPPERLLAAATAYLRADYERVLELLAGAELGEERAAAHACLLRAAARWGLAAMAVEEERSALLDAAHRELGSCGAEDRGVEPLARAFPPDFRAFYRAAATPAQPP
ncbi:MAG TPA: hypothetical protein VMT16_14155 [Thermoanaerobaculia bacterium]|nr:hypothetical protein [Thermoanaerobaculia bacterium]